MVDQVGGTHYSRAGDFQHWDLWLVIKPYEGNTLIYAATKYLARLDMKESSVGVKKAISYCEKYLAHHKQKASNPLLLHTIHVAPEPIPVDRILQTFAADKADPRIVGVYVTLSNYPSVAAVESCVKLLKSYASSIVEAIAP